MLRQPTTRISARFLACVTLAAVAFGVVPSSPAVALEDRSAARIDIIVGEGGIVDPLSGAEVRVILRADETGGLGSSDVTLTLTDDAFTSEDQIRRFIAGESEPVGSIIATEVSPEVPALESREMGFQLNPEVLPVPRTPNPDPDGVPVALSPARIYGLEVTYGNGMNPSPGLRQLSGRQVVIVRPAGVDLGQASIAPIVTLTTSAIGGVALRPEELEALTIEGGALDQVTDALTSFPATVAIDSRITSSITVLGEQAPPESLAWAQGLGALGLQQFGLPWADANPLESLAIDTLVYARLGEYPWVHDGEISDEQLATLATRSASAVLLSSDSLRSDRAVVSVGDARIIRVDAQLSALARDALQAPTVLEAQADLQRAQGIIAFRAIVDNPEILVFSTGRLPATAIAPRLGSVLEGFSSMEVADVVAVPLAAAATETLSGVSTVLASRERQEFVNAIRALWETDVAFATIALDPEEVVFGRWTRYQALLSSTWSEDPNGLASEWERAKEGSHEFHNSVRVEQGSAITVLADQTSLPVTVQNDLPSEVAVTLVIRPTTGILAIEQPEITLTIPAGSSTRTLVPVRSLANGTTPVEFTLLSAAGDPIGEMVTIPITIRAGWEGVISLVLSLLVGGTFAFGLVRAIQRRRNDREVIA